MEFSEEDVTEDPCGMVLLWHGLDRGLFVADPSGELERLEPGVLKRPGEEIIHQPTILSDHAAGAA